MNTHRPRDPWVHRYAVRLSRRALPFRMCDIETYINERAERAS
jgi:hypothetical protein